MRSGTTTLLLLLSLFALPGGIPRDPADSAAAERPPTEIGLDLSAAGSPAATNPLGETPAGLVALTLHECARHEAQARFWELIALAANGPVDARRRALDEALQELRAGLALAEQQLEARATLMSLLGTERYDPELDPGRFSHKVTHPLMPLVPGRTLVYERSTPEGVERIEVTTLSETVEIAGITCTAVRELEFLAGEVVEDTENWFAQKDDGSVWYFGELSQHFEDGRLADTEGSWRVGEDGALPGVVMLAQPVPGDAYRQEYHLNGSEDFARVISIGNTLNLASGPVTGCVEVEESSPLDPEERERKFFAPRIGLVREVDLETGEVLDLIEIIE